MKLFVIILLALMVQVYAYSSYESSEEDSDYLRPYSSHWYSTAASFPEAKSFKTKVTKRIKNSHALSGKTKIQEKLFEMANEKLEECKKPHGHELDKHCVGRITGKMMQMITSAENNVHLRRVNMDY